MAKPRVKNTEMRNAIKDALHELLVTEPEFLRSILLEAIEDISLGQAIQEGRKSKTVARETVFKILEGKK
jgi:hypothetical protein